MLVVCHPRAGGSAGAARAEHSRLGAEVKEKKAAAAKQQRQAAKMIQDIQARGRAKSATDWTKSELEWVVCVGVCVCVCVWVGAVSGENEIENENED